MKGDRDRETPSSPAKRSNPVIVQGAEARTIWRSWLRKGGATSGKRLQVAPLSTLEEIGESEWRRVLGRTVRRHFGDSRPLWGGLESGDESPLRRNSGHPKAIHGYVVGSRRTRTATFRGG